MDSKKILITGTDGFIGNNLKTCLESEGYNVYGTCFFKPPRENEYKVDIRTEEGLQSLPNLDFDVIIHTAGIVDQNSSKKLIFAVNYGGTKNILNWSKNHNCKHFIQISSSSVYGLRTGGENRSESKLRRIKGHFGIPYGRSKAKAEKLVEKSGLNYTILRLPAIFGKNDSFISPAIISQLKEGTFCFCGEKDKLYSTLYVKNFCGIISKLLKVEPLNDFFNCVDYQITWKTFIKEYTACLGMDLPKKKKSIFTILTHLNDKNYLSTIIFSRFGGDYPNDKLKKVLSYEPEFPWQDGIKEAIDSWKKQI